MTEHPTTRSRSLVWFCLVASLILILGISLFFFFVKSRAHSSLWFRLGNRTITLLGTPPPPPSESWESITRKKNPTIRYLGNLEDGMAGFQDRTGKWGWVDSKGDVVIPPTFDMVGIFRNGITWAMSRGEDVLIDTHGKIIFGPVDHIENTQALSGGRYEINYDQGKKVTIDSAGNVQPEDVRP